MRMDLHETIKELAHDGKITIEESCELLDKFIEEKYEAYSKGYAKGYEEGVQKGKWLEFLENI